MTKTYKVKWYDWNAGHYNEKECTSKQLNPLFSKLNAKKGISDIISEVNTNDFTQHYCPICRVYEIFNKKDNNTYKCMKCQKYTLTIMNQ